MLFRSEAPQTPYAGDSRKPALDDDEEFISTTEYALRCMMNDRVGIIRQNEPLEDILKWLTASTIEVDQIYKARRISAPLVELRNLLVVAELIVKQSRDRKENKGVFFKEDREEVNGSRSQKLNLKSSVRIG